MVDIILTHLGRRIAPAFAPPALLSCRMDAKYAVGEPRLLISRAALLHNARIIRRQIGPGVKLCAMVKADAYGHGASLVTDTLCNFDGGDTDAFAAPAADQ